MLVSFAVRAYNFIDNFNLPYNCFNSVGFRVVYRYENLAEGTPVIRR